MRSHFVLLLVLALVLAGGAARAQDDYQPGPDSLVQAGIPQGQLIKGSYTAKEGGVFPGTERDYTIYLPVGFDKSKPAPFMVFQDGVIYNAPTVFDNLIAKGQIPPLIGIFIKPGIVPAANPNALPRYNRSYEYDSVSDTYSRFLLDEFLPAIKKKHHLRLSTDPNDAAIAGNSSGGICAFMTAWHRPDRFRRVFSGVGTYVGIHGADQLPVLVRKFEPRPLRIYLQSGEHDNDLYCGDWWMANQTMERALKWAGYDVNHTWGTGGHNAKHATAIFPDVLRWLWRDYSTAKEIKANPRGESKWLGYSVLKENASWEKVTETSGFDILYQRLTSDSAGNVYAPKQRSMQIEKIRVDGTKEAFKLPGLVRPHEVLAGKDGSLIVRGIEVLRDPLRSRSRIIEVSPAGVSRVVRDADLEDPVVGLSLTHSGLIVGQSEKLGIVVLALSGKVLSSKRICCAVNSSTTLTPDQTMVYVGGHSIQLGDDGSLKNAQDFTFNGNAQCADAEGRLYVLSEGILHVCDQAGRVNFIMKGLNGTWIESVCFGGKDLSDLFISCFDEHQGADLIYRHPTKAHGIVSGQMAPIKPPPPKL